MLKENKLDYFGYAGTSNLTDKHYKERLNNNFEYSLYSILLVDKKHLRFTFHAFPTYLSNKSRPNEYDKKVNSYYTIQIQFLNATDIVDYDKFVSKDIKVNGIKNIVKNCEVQFYSNDESFYWQGFWEDLDSNNSSIYSFKGTNGKGVWRGNHERSGGLIDPKKRVTKHIKQLIEDFDLILNNQLPRYLKSHQIKFIQGSNVFKESYSEYQKAQLSAFEHQIKNILESPKFKIANTLPKLKKELDNIYGISDESKSIKKKIENVVLSDYNRYSKSFDYVYTHRINLDSIFSSSLEETDLHTLSDFYSDPKVLELLVSLYSIKPSKSGHEDVGKGEVLFAAILNSFTYSAQFGDLINTDGDLLEIKSNNGKFSGSKKFDNNIRNIDFTEIFIKDLNSSDYNLSENVQEKLQNPTEGLDSIDYRPLKNKICRYTYENLVDTITEYPEEKVNIENYFKDYVENIVRNLITDDIIGLDDCIDFCLAKFTDEVFESSKNIIQNFYKTLVAINVFVYISNEFINNAHLRYLILCTNTGEDVQFAGLNLDLLRNSKVLVDEVFKNFNVFDRLGLDFNLNLSKYARGITSIKFKTLQIKDIFKIFTETFRNTFTPNIIKNEFATDFITDNLTLKSYADTKNNKFIIKEISTNSDNNIVKNQYIFDIDVSGSKCIINSDTLDTPKLANSLKDAKRIIKNIFQSFREKLI